MYSVQLSSKAQKQIKKLNPKLQAEILEALYFLEVIPRPDGCKKLKGYENMWRVAVKRFRILYRIEDDMLIIEVIEIVARKDAYKKK